MRSARFAWIFALIAFAAVATVAFAAPTIDQRLPLMRPMPAPALRTMAPLPVSTAAAATQSANTLYVGAMPPNTRVPMSRLPRLPQASSANTYTPKNKGKFRPMSATGAYINIDTYTNCAAQGALGDQFNVGCVVGWRAAGMAAGDTKQDYVVVSTNGNELNASATATGATYTNAASPATRNTTLSPAGTYVLGTYDVTAGQWIAVAYVNSGQVFAISVYQDPYHTTQTYQFDASASPAAYIYLQNVAQGDYYVVGVTQTSVAPNCMFMAPAPSLGYVYPANQLCQLTASAGVQAPGGNLAVTWPINSSYKAGNYSVEVYDLTQGVRLGQVQVSITGASGLILNTYPDDSGVNANPSPNPRAVATPSTILAWDGNNPLDESVTGVKTTINGLTNGANYLWSLSDPQGQVIANAAGTVAGGTGSNTFTFDALTGGATPAMLQPGQYPAKSFVVQLYDTTHKNVVASQSLQVLGYATQTQFNNAGTLGSTVALSPGGGGTIAGLRITNNSNGIFNGFGDNLSKIIFSTGPDFTVSGTTGNGVMASVVNGATTPCALCTTTATDSAGNVWNVTVTCSSGGTQKNGECNIEFDPTSTSISLAPGAYIELDTITWFNSTGSQCGNACQGITSEMPQHGLQWSNTSSALAWQPVYFRNSNASESGTGEFRMMGSINAGTRNAVANAPPAFSVPFVGTHYYRANFGQADYNLNSPYNVPNTHYNIEAFTVNNTGTNRISEVAIELPPLLLTQGIYNADALSAWATVACPANFSSQWICFNGSTINAGASSTVYVDMTPTLQSFPFQELQMQAFANNQWFSLTAAPGTNTTPDGLNAVDNLAMGLYSLIGGDMTTYFNPNTVGNGSTANLGFVVQNTSTSVDPNPDSIDAIVIEAPSTGYTLSSTPTVANPGWSYLGQFKLNGATTTQYWFGLCAAQYTNGAQQGAAAYGGPPAANSSPVTLPLGAAYKTIGTCANENQSAGPGVRVTASNMQLTNFATNGAQTWHMYAHGANSGGWSSAQNFTLTVTPESASVWFNQINGAAVAQNTVPTIGGSPNTYQYAIKNTSQTSSIGTTVVTIPGIDVNNINATDSSGQTWNVTNITGGGVTLSAPGGQADGTGGCTVNTAPASTYNPTTAGANGQITISGCTTFKPGDTIYVNFSAASPSSQSDSYVFPATVDGNAAGAAWLGANEITVQFSLGLNLVVNPTNPGPGGSTPVVSCGNPCAFSGTTVDFGNIANNASFNFNDVVRASVIYTGATSAGHNLMLYVSAASNPVNSTGTPANEMLTDVDSVHSTTGAGITFNQTAFAVVPTTTPGMLLATVPETNSSKGYDVIQNYQIAIGAEAITAHIITVTYTVVPN